jgi:mRNA interferase MazF
MKANRGEIWRVEFDPSTGQEIGKIRPAVIVSENSIGKLPLKIVVPVTDWKDRYDMFPWFVCLRPSETNRLTKISGADAFQVKSVSEDRLKGKIGDVSPSDLDDIVHAIALCIGL